MYIIKMSDDIYCGIGKVPKNKKMGSMKECGEANQIRQYGIKKVDKKLIDSILAEKQRKSSSVGKLETKAQKLGEDFVILKAKIKKLQSKIEYETDKKTKDQLKKDLAALETKKNKISTDLSIAEKIKTKNKNKTKTKSKSKSSSRQVKKFKSKSRTNSKSKRKRSVK
jgi:hypothetical protein